MLERRRSGTAKINTLTSAIADVAPVEERLTLLAQPRLTGRLKKGKFMYAKASPPAAALIDSFSKPQSSWLQLDTQTPEQKR